MIRSLQHYKAYPATINTDEDEAGELEQYLQTPDKEKMWEPTNHEVKQVQILHDDDINVDEEYPTYAQESQEYMHWHYKLNHPTHTVMIKMGEKGMLPRRITKILATMDMQQTKAPMCNDCCGAKETRKPWRG
jgi:hypothetical protein